VIPGVGRRPTSLHLTSLCVAATGTAFAGDERGALFRRREPGGAGR